MGYDPDCHIASHTQDFARSAYAVAVTGPLTGTVMDSYTELVRNADFKKPRHRQTDKQS